jgi:hypothetical protein
MARKSIQRSNGNITKSNCTQIVGHKKSLIEYAGVSMPTAWESFHSSVQILSGPESQRNRLARVFSEQLVHLSKKDVPAEIRDDFLRILTKAVRNAERVDAHSIVENLADVEDRDVIGMINTIIRMYDTVTRYQPILRSGLGLGGRTEPEKGFSD